MGQQSLKEGIEVAKEQIFEAIQDGDAFQVEETLQNLYNTDIITEGEVEFTCTNLMGAFSIQGQCNNKSDANLVLRRLYKLFKDSFYIHTHGTFKESDNEWHFYINIKDRQR